MKRPLAVGVAVLLFFVALTVAMTWPQAAHMGTHVANSDDPLLSIWRVSWIAHALRTRPADLFNGNIFYPEARTLAYSDSVLLQGLIAAPMIWAGVSNVTAYNVVLLGSFAVSGLAMFLYAFELTRNRRAALLAGIIFAFPPYRFDHFHHLELQAAMFIPLTLWFLERALASGRASDILGACASFACQVLSGIYYAIFFATALLFIVPYRLWGLELDRRRVLLTPAVMGVISMAVVVGPYLSVYSLNRSSLGDRAVTDVLLYSATPSNYISAPIDNRLTGEWSAPLGQNERHLSPGLLAFLLAGFAFARRDRQRITLLILGITGLVISLGLNTPIYQVLLNIGVPYRGLRVPARAAILVVTAVAALAAFGWSVIEGRVRRKTLAAVAVGALMLFEYATRMESWLILPDRQPPVYRWLAGREPSVIVQFPLSTPDRLNVIHDSLYMLGSTVHWHPILNGYSGYFSQSYLDMLDYARTFPDDRSMEYFKSRGVELIVVHSGYMTPDRFGAMTAGLVARPDVEAIAQFEGETGTDMVFRVRR